MEILTYQKNLFKLFVYNNVQYAFFKFNKYFGLYYTYIFYNYDPIEHSIYIIQWGYRKVNDNGEVEEPVPEKIKESEFIDKYEKILINHQCMIIHGDFFEFNRYLHENYIVGQYMQNFLKAKMIKSINMLNKIPMPVDFTKNNIDNMLNLINDYNARYLIKRHINPWFKDPKFIIPTSISFIAIVISVIALFI